MISFGFSFSDNEEFKGISELFDGNNGTSVFSSFIFLFFSILHFFAIEKSFVSGLHEKKRIKIQVKTK